jgi:hypothetical protein
MRLPRSVTRSRCRAFTVMESLIALGILMVAMTLVVQVGIWSAQERTRNAARQEAIETAANVLEAARAVPSEALTPEWAAAQALPESLTQRMTEPQLTVKVEPEAGRSRTRRVTVEIAWKSVDGSPARPVKLMGLFSERSAAAGGGKE